MADKTTGTPVPESAFDEIAEPAAIVSEAEAAAPAAPAVPTTPETGAEDTAAVTVEQSRARNERLKQDAGVAWGLVGGMHSTLVPVGKGERPVKREEQPPAKKRPPKPEPFKPDTGVVEAILGAEMFKTLEKIYSKPRWTPEDLEKDDK